MTSRFLCDFLLLASHFHGQRSSSCNVCSEHPRPTSTCEVCSQHWFQSHRSSIGTKQGLQEFQDSGSHPDPLGPEMLGVGLGIFNMPSRGSLHAHGRNSWGHAGLCIARFLISSLFTALGLCCCACSRGCLLVVVRRASLPQCLSRCQAQLSAQGSVPALPGPGASGLGVVGPAGLAVPSQWDLPRRRGSTVSLTLAGGFFTNEPPGKQVAACVSTSDHDG